MKLLLFIYTILTMIFSFLTPYFWRQSNYYHDLAANYGAEADSLRGLSDEWRIKYKLATAWTEEFELHIDSIKGKGHRPEKSLVYQTMKEFLNWPNLSWWELDSLYTRESGWGRDGRKGTFGEVSAAQMDTSTLKESLQDIGFEVIGFDYKNYHNVVSASEMSALYITRIKLLNEGRFDHVIYYNGFRTVMKKYNTAKFDKYMRDKKGMIYQKNKWVKIK